MQIEHENMRVSRATTTDATQLPVSSMSLAVGIWNTHRIPQTYPVGPPNEQSPILVSTQRHGGPFPNRWIIKKGASTWSGQQQKQQDGPSPSPELSPFHEVRLEVGSIRRCTPDKETTRQHAR